MNETRERIVQFLWLNGFQTTKAVARSLDVSERTVNRHLDSMIKERAIKVVAVPNPVSLGYRAWSKVGIKVDPSRLRQVAEAMVRHPSVYFVAYALGRFDIIIAVHFATIEKLAFFVNTELAGLAGVANTEIWMFASPRKYYHFSWPAPLSGEEGGGAGVNPLCKLDDIDRNILALLREDGLARPREIKDRLGLGESTIRKRVRYMLDHNVFIREALLRPQFSENETWATVGISTRGLDAHRVIDRLLKFPAVYLASVSLGKFNVLIAGRFRNANMLHQFATIDLPSIEGINSTETFVHNKPLKYHNIAMAEME